MRQGRSGFTLIEMLISLALGALILVASSTLLISITGMWIEEEDLDDFQDHVNGVRQFIQAHVSEGSYLNGEKSLESKLRLMPGDRSRTADLNLSFVMRAPHPILSRELGAGLVKCFVFFREETGLVLAYHRLYSKKGPLAKEPIFQVNLSEWVQGLKYHYYDPKSDQWDVFSSPQDRAVKEGLAYPHFVQIDFKKGEDEAFVLIRLFTEAEKGGARI